MPSDEKVPVCGKPVDGDEERRCLRTAGHPGGCDPVDLLCRRVWRRCECDRTYHDECPIHGVYGQGLGPSGKVRRDNTREELEL